ncbi:fibronectin type III domain-containing protein [Microaerobacter geothermalis]|uniref:stalk domain-containing protein n=1 Tax=Microaerobacter geothermalis TaxID=674972 RepID=UPI001EEC6FA0|nr:stalk domain-containing protein [Microaerobacter geothermalis]MCF6095382.1 fibronectin type III domain-containing protein [Microaerobacter geothermalis]
MSIKKIVLIVLLLMTMTGVAWAGETNIDPRLYEQDWLAPYIGKSKIDPRIIERPNQVIGKDITTDGLTMSWDSVKNAVSYGIDVYQYEYPSKYADNPDESKKVYSQTTSKTNIVVTGLKPDTRYLVQLYTIFPEGRKSHPAHLEVETRAITKGEAVYIPADPENGGPLVPYIDASNQGRDGGSFGQYEDLIVLMNWDTATDGIKRDNSVSVSIDGLGIKFPDAQPYINEDDRTMVPVRFIAEARHIEADVSWNPFTRTVTIEKPNSDGKTKTIIKLKVGENKGLVNGREVTFDTKAVIKDDRTMVPLRFVVETLGARVFWDPRVKAVIIYTPNERAYFDEDLAEEQGWIEN